MTELDERLTAMLHSRAEEDDMNIEALLAGAQRRGRVLRRRRNVIGACVAAVLLVAGLLSAVGLLTAPPTDEVATRPDALRRPPLAQNASGEIGDGRLFHLDLPGFVTQTPDSVDWSTGQGQERLSVRREPYVPTGFDESVDFISDIELILARTPFESRLSKMAGSVISSAKVRGNPATVWTRGDRVSVSWQPSVGEFVELVNLGDVASTLRAAALVRLDRTRRCAISGKLGPAPSGAPSPLLPLLANAPSSCSMAFSKPYPSTSVYFTFETWYLKVYAAATKLTDRPNATVNGRPALAQATPNADGQMWASVEIQFEDHVVNVHAGPDSSPDAYTPFDLAAIVALAEGYTETSGPDPANWPISPID